MLVAVAAFKKKEAKHLNVSKHPWQCSFLSVRCMNWGTREFRIIT